MSIVEAAICHHCGNLIEVTVDGYFKDHSYNGREGGKRCEGSDEQFEILSDEEKSTQLDTVSVAEQVPERQIPSSWRQSATVPLPNGTKLTIEGDGDIIQQILNRLNGLELHWDAKNIVDPNFNQNKAA